MPLIPPPCVVKGCHEPVAKAGRCEEHKPEPYQSRRSERLPSDWQMRRRITFQKFDWTCHICGSNTPPADTIDHIVAGDDHSLSNLAPVHDQQAPHCHRRKTSQEGVNARTHAQPNRFGAAWVADYLRRQEKP